MTGAKVGGRMAKFDYQLVTGDIVEIQTTTSSSYGPNRNWLDVARTSQARGKIRAWFRKERREENITEGKNMLEREFKRNSMPLDEKLLQETAKELRFESVDDFFAAIGYDGIQVSRVIHKARDIHAASIAGESESPSEIITAADIDLSDSIAKKQSKGVVVEGVDNCLVRFANCCTPLPGDEIKGFITRGYGVSVHKSDCINLQSNEDNERLINVSWVHYNDLYYRAAIEIIAEDRTALIADVTSVISENKLSMSEFNARILKNKNASIEITLEIANLEQLKSILAKLSKIHGVIMAVRRDS
jgi:GTP pyrophosphokinase